MNLFEKEVRGMAQEGVHLRVSKGFVQLLADYDFRDVDVYFVLEGTREKISTVLDILSLGVGYDTVFRVALESQNKPKEELSDLFEEVELALTHNFGVAI